MDTHEIKERKDIYSLVNTFYSKVKQDELIGPIFNNIIFNETLWAHHFEKLTDFWEVNLFGSGKFEGNPIEVHAWVDMQFDFKIDGLHFDRWLYLWHQTLNENFHGTVAEFAHQRADAMGKRIHERLVMGKEKYGR